MTGRPRSRRATSGVVVPISSSTTDVVGHQRGRPLGHALLELETGVRGEGSLPLEWIAGVGDRRAGPQHGAAVGAGQLTVAVQQVEIPPDGGLADLKGLSEIADRRRTPGAQCAHDAVLAFAEDHRPSLRPH